VKVQLRDLQQIWGRNGMTWPRIVAMEMGKKECKIQDTFCKRIYHTSSVSKIRVKAKRRIVSNF
jgi:hypothetical protein